MDDWDGSVARARQAEAAREAEGYRATAVQAKESRPLGCALAMRVMQSNLYKQLDDAERADCDELVRQNLDWFKRDCAPGVKGKTE